jgi:transketolase
MASTQQPRELAGRIRRAVIEQSHRAHVGHIGSALSVADILAALFAGVLRDGDDRERDRFVLSKGHAALALYGALHHTGRLSAERLESFCGEDSELGVHPEHTLPGIDFSTGSLGHGLSIAAGAALAARMQGADRRAFALLSDAELNEGSIWEAVMFAAHHRLSNLVAIVDLNGQQALGYTGDVIDLSPLADRFRAFGWDTSEVDGHDADGLARQLRGLGARGTQPHAVIARTTFGRGVSFMESRIAWHYWPMSDEQYEQALAELQIAR